MSANPHDHAAEEAHTGPIKNPKQLLVAVFFSFVVPIFAIIGLVYYVVSDAKPAGATGSAMALAGISEEGQNQGIAARIQKIGTVEIRDANRALKSGEDVFKAQCSSCHTTGLVGAPKFGDAAAWGLRLKSGLEALVHSALAGKGAMGAQAGGDFDDTEIARAVVYMANAGGANFPIPERPAAAASEAVAAAP